MAKIRILIVDDNAAFLRSVSQLIASYQDFQLVGLALSAGDALEKIPFLRPDLVLMDMVMPDLGGLEATRLIKAEPNAPRVIICTLYHDARYEEAATGAGADGFLSKSALSKQLLPLAHGLFGLHTG